MNCSGCCVFLACSVCLAGAEPDRQCGASVEIQARVLPGAEIACGEPVFARVVFSNKSNIAAWLVGISGSAMPCRTLITVRREGKIVRARSGRGADLNLFAARALLPGESVTYVANLTEVRGRSRPLDPGTYTLSVFYDSNFGTSVDPRVRRQRTVLPSLRFAVLEPGHGGARASEELRRVRDCGASKSSPAHHLVREEGGFFDLELLMEEGNRFPYGERTNILVGISNNTSRPLQYCESGLGYAPTRVNIELYRDGKLVPPVVLYEGKVESGNVWPLLPGERLLANPMINFRRPPLPPGRYTIKATMSQDSSEYGLARGEAEAQAEFEIVPTRDMPEEMPKEGPLRAMEIRQGFGLGARSDESRRNFAVCKHIPGSWGFGTGAPEAPVAEEEAPSGATFPWWPLALAACGALAIAVAGVIVWRWRRRKRRAA